MMSPRIEFLQVNAKECTYVALRCPCVARRYNLIVVHGGLVPGVPLEQQQLVHLAALRDVIPQPDGRCVQKIMVMPAGSQPQNE
jgi:hypothetical protein